jgi:hypothetical protein
MDMCVFDIMDFFNHDPGLLFARATTKPEKSVTMENAFDGKLM